MKGRFVVDTSGDAGSGRRRTAGSARSSKIVIVDIAAPLAAYNVLRSAGLTTVTALMAGANPADPPSPESTTAPKPT
jgi:hypothetical protein